MLEYHMYYALNRIEAGSLPVKSMIEIVEKNGTPKHYRSIGQRAFGRIAYCKQLSDDVVKKYNLLYRPTENFNVRHGGYQNVYTRVPD